tara:strand:+ start:1572 stop:1832 length:261 start_codon:yes stop_codon:yes gene_type:complete
MNMSDDELQEIEDLIGDLENEVNRLLKEREILLKNNERLRDEVDSLWSMMDEMTKTDIENWSKILEELSLDVVHRALMVSKKKVDC